jgi:hypothetical protein
MRLEVCAVLEQPRCGVAAQNGPRFGVLLQYDGQSQDIPNQHGGQFRQRLHHLDCDLSGMHAKAHCECLTVSEGIRMGMDLQAIANGQRRQRGSPGVVFVRHGHAKDCQHAIAQQGLERPSVLLHDPLNEIVPTVHQAV